MEQFILRLIFFGAGAVIGGLVAFLPLRRRAALAVLILSGPLLLAFGYLCLALGIFPDLRTIFGMGYFALYSWLFWPVLLLYNSVSALVFYGLGRGAQWGLRHLRDKGRQDG